MAYALYMGPPPESTQKSYNAGESVSYGEQQEIERWRAVWEDGVCRTQVCRIAKA